MEPYDFQKNVAQLIRRDRNVILQAPTGAGKTFASLLPFFQSWTNLDSRVPRKCLYSVPMRVLANQFTVEYDRFVKERLRNVLELPDVEVQTGERPEDKEFKADLTFATIDQVLSSWLMHPYSLSRRQGNVNAGALVGSYLVFDEFHLFDPNAMLPTTLHMLKTLQGISPFVLMTATFSADMLQELAQLLDAEALLLTPEDLQGIDSQNKERRFHVQEDLLVAEEIAQPQFVLERHRAQTNDVKRSIVIFNQVERAQRFYESLRRQAAGETEIRLLHSRFQSDDRRRIEEEARREFGKERAAYKHESMILVATQAIEVGLDVTCQAMHTELAPASSVLQRAGRCARYEGEIGDVYVYPVESSGPYFGEAEAQSERARDWLRENQDRHLSFEDEQTLVNHAHTPTDRQILMQLEAGDFEHRESIRALWRGEGGRPEAQRLIRDIQSQSLLVHGNPDRLLHAPFNAESFSLHPGTLQGKFERWEEEAAEDFMREALPWAVCRLVEVESDEQANRPLEYKWKPVAHKSEMPGAPLLAVHPQLVAYGADVGLTLYADNEQDGDDRYECAVPEKKRASSWKVFYRLETYEEHIRLVHDVFMENESDFRSAAGRLEQANGWQTGLVTEMAHLVVWLHDLGKLGQGWQRWAEEWQAAIGRPHHDGALAHTDYDSENERHRRADRQLKRKRPPHAVEGALAAVPFLFAQVDGHLDHPLLRAAFTAIARHHAPHSSHTEGYELVPACVRELEETADLLPDSLAALGRAVPESGQFALRLKTEQLPEPDYIRRKLLVDEREPADICAYMLLVRALRNADREGTKRGAER